MTDKKEKPRHLGRGLQSLIGPFTLPAESAAQVEPLTSQEGVFPPDHIVHESLRQLPIDRIQPNPYQPRKIWKNQDLNDLSESIKANGVIQPLIVRKTGEVYELIAGERRLRAAKMAGLSDVPALIRQADDSEMLELALVENIHRADLNPLERAKAYQEYLDKFDLTQADAAQRLGEDRSVIANYLRLLSLPGEIQQMLIDEQLDMGHARAILALPTDELRRKLAHRAMAGRLSVREVERLVRQQLEPQKSDKIIGNIKPSHILDLENRIRSELGTKVIINTDKGGKRGKIIIEFYSLDEFDAIAARLGLREIDT